MEYNRDQETYFSRLCFYSTWNDKWVQVNNSTGWWAWLPSLYVSPNTLWPRLPRTVQCAWKALNFTELHWPKEAYGKCSSIFFILRHKATRFQNHTGRLTQEPWTRPSGSFTGMGTLVHNVFFWLRHSFTLVFQILRCVTLLFGSTLRLIYFLKASCNPYLLNKQVKEWIKHILLFKKETEKQALYAVSYLQLYTERKK